MKCKKRKVYVEKLLAGGRIESQSQTTHIIARERYSCSRSPIHTGRTFYLKCDNGIEKDTREL